MQNFSQSDNPAEKVVFVTKLEDIPGGITVSVADFVEDFIVPAGSVVGKDNNGLFHVLKTAKMHTAANSSATDYLVYKGHGLKVGDYIASATGAKAYAITAINTTGSDVYDTISIGTTLGVAVAQYAGLFQAAAEAASNTSAFKYTPYAVTGHSVQLKAGDNNTVDALLRATMIEANAPVATTQIKAALPQILWV